MTKDNTDASRLKFEAFVKSELGDIAVSDDSGRYISHKIQNYWRTWQESEICHVSRADAERDALANAPNNDLSVVLLERIAKTLNRLGFATPEGGIECFNARIETQLYNLCRGVDSVLESIKPIINERDALLALRAIEDGPDPLTIAYMHGYRQGAEQVKALEADAGRYRWLSEYFISDNTQHDDSIVDAKTVAQLSYLIDAEIKVAEK